MLLLRRTGSIDSDPVTNSYNFISDDIVINAHGCESLTSFERELIVVPCV